MPRNLGELAIQEFVSNQLDEIIPPEDPVLSLFEDRAVKKVRLSDPRIHLLTMKSLLFVLEQLHLVESAAVIRVKVQRCGRDPSETEIDAPVDVRLGGSEGRPERCAFPHNAGACFGGTECGNERREAVAAYRPRPVR